MSNIELPNGAPGLDAEELEALVDSVRGVCAGLWPDATASATGDLAELWTAAVRQGWTELGSPELLTAAIAIQAELGRHAAPLPIVDIFLASLVAHLHGDDALVAAIADGSVRPVVAHPLNAGNAQRGVVRHVEAATIATHILIAHPGNNSLGWHSLSDAEVAPLEGMAVPSWSQVRVLSEPEWSVPLSDFPDFLRIRRIGLAARAAAAVTRTHEYALEHANQRKQFGKLIGSFQAVSHRLVDSAITLTAAEELLGHIGELYAAQDPAWVLASEIYIEHIEEKLPSIQFDSHHTLAAIGYFDESAAPWLFRRAHADLAQLAAITSDHSVGEYLLDSGLSLPEYDRGPAAAAIRNEVFEAFGPWMNGAPPHLHTWKDDARQVLRDRNWIGVGWPKEFGGGGWDVSSVMAFSEAIAYAAPPVGNIWMGINSIAPMVMKVGKPELQELVIAEVKKGDLSIALGYSEPEAGSDLASLTTRAERVDGGWRINGQKMWGTCFPDSRWVVLAARTDPDASPRHAGISMFLVDTDSEGITVSPHTSLGGDVSATTFWDNVFVPESRLIGKENEGWAALMTALASERVLIGAAVMRTHRAFDRLLTLLRANPEAVTPRRRGSYTSEIGRLAVGLQAARALVNRAVREIASGESGSAPMAKIAATEMSENLNATAVSLLGPDSLYEWGVDGASGDGYFEDGLRVSMMGVIAGGTGDIQRNMVARTIGLPK
jgi:alkylation response protein AidB-like acyl-CoA dehydrogenase